MSIELPARGPLTDELIAYLNAHATGILVGDAIRPADSGWPQTPQVNDFVSYVTVGTGPGGRVPTEADTLASAHTAWLFTYTFTSCGGARKQADWTADQIRAASLSFRDVSPLTLGDEDWSIESVRFDRVGSVDRNDATDPPFWQVVDSCVIRVSRQRKRGSA